MIPIQVESAWKGTSDCRNCGVRHMVLFADLNEEDFSRLHTPIDDLHYEPGHSLYLEGDSARSVYTLRTGMVKLVRTMMDGRQRIVRVLRPGDVIGIEALAQAKTDSEAVTLSEVGVCRIPVDVLKDLADHSPRLHTRLMQKWHHALKEADDWLAQLNFGTARQRVANIILKMRNPEDPSFTTLFSREDMGAMLDLKLETVSREVSHWVKSGAIQPLDKQGRAYRVINALILEKA
jgi:CRP/FNR family transcriptional regulator, anaerobic regulatory protein